MPPSYAPIPPRAERAAQAVVDAAYRVHSGLGPGLLECVYEACLCHELRRMSIPFTAQAAVPVVYDGVALDAGLRLDLLVDDSVVVELKAVEKVLGEIGIQDKPTLRIFNKEDCFPDKEVLANLCRRFAATPISARVPSR